MIYLGYGICEPFTNPRRGTEKGRLTKSCLTENQNFKVIVSWRDITKDYSNEEYTKIISLMKDSLKIIGLLGGLGSKARKGFGSLTLLSFIDEYNKSSYSHPMTRDDLSKVINEILPYDKLPAKQPPFSAFSQYTRIIILENRNDPKQLLNSIGLKMQRYRSWGSNGRVNNENAEKNFKNDHDLAIEISNKTRINEHPKRIMFGLPHNYFFSSNSAKVNFDAEGNLSDRRASPLFLHIHDCINKNYLAIAMIMDSLFLSNEIKIKAKLLERHNPFQLIFDCKEDYSVLHEFIDGRIGPRDNKTKEYYFPNRLTILGKQVNKEGSK